MKMNLKFVLICAVFFVEVKTECGDYLTCLSELIHGFFGTKYRNSTINEDFSQKDETDLYEIKDFSDKHLDKILNQVSSIVKDNVTGDILESRSKIAEFMNGKTKVLIKVFDFDKPVESGKTEKPNTTEGPKTFNSQETKNTLITEQQMIFATLPTSTDIPDLNTENIDLFTSTENIKDTLLTTDLIYQVNNMAVKFDNFEDNLILPDIYVDIGDNNTDYPNIDYIDLYKDVTVESVDFVPTQPSIVDIENLNAEKDIENNLIDFPATGEKLSNILSQDEYGISTAVFPWIATIFIKNETRDNQFEYYCDGALLNNRFVLTAGRCIKINNVTVNPDNILIVLGKKSLHAVGEDEKVHKVKSIKTHENFTIRDEGAKNDLTALELDGATSFNGAIQPADIIGDISDVENEATTAWGFTGELTQIVFDKEASRKCTINSSSENTFCATYSNDVALCPSYGGLHVVRQADRWYLRGIRTGDPEQRGICLNRDVTYTDLLKYKDWIVSITS
ncbi:uncharacterized protein LOC128680906 isoform X1 [Plodia interpunctella]|uniref:uncharacterized protein LOC128680906 isoform X1 n=1 Tax=Plodia interpunctella TaxID=58824 RepID=UPI0023686774|nr:uncharacterized protein LOC128680906 isoform X1 [Plodia interpunctella]